MVSITNYCSLTFDGYVQNTGSFIYDSPGSLVFTAGGHTLQDMIISGNMMTVFENGYQLSGILMFDSNNTVICGDVTSLSDIEFSNTIVASCPQGFISPYVRVNSVSRINIVNDIIGEVPLLIQSPFIQLNGDVSSFV